MSNVIYPWDPKYKTSQGREKSPMLQAALLYASMGWHVFPVHHLRPDDPGRCSCSNPTCDRQAKHPLTPSGLNDATTDPALVHHWWSQWPHANIGLRTGRVSGLVVVDVDNHVYHGGENGEEALQRLVAQYGPLPDTVEAMTGGLGGRHLYFRYPALPEGAGVKSRTSSLGPGIDVRGDGGYVIAPPSVGLRGPYEWEGSSDPTEGVAALDMPEWLVQLVTSEIRHHDGGDYGGDGSGFLHPKTAEELRAALQFIDPDNDRHDPNRQGYGMWIAVGMALKSIDAGETAFLIWDEWSQRGAKYKAEEMAFKWRSFKTDGGLNKESIFYWAAERGWRNPIGQGAATAPPEPVPLDQVQLVDRLERDDTPLPSHLLIPPGMLGEVVHWANRTAPKKQPALAVQAALAVGSVVAGRLYRTDRNNFSSLYFLNIAGSASGKEHAKTVVESVLEAAELDSLIGGAGYTSAPAVFSALQAKPQHITVIDELGKAVQASQAKGNQHQSDVWTTLMEVFGRTHGSIFPKSYSTMTLNQQQRDAMQGRKVVHPALTLLGMTTPSTFYENISSGWVKDGFLGRFLVVESNIGRQPGQFGQSEAVPQRVIDWARQVRFPGGNLQGVHSDPTMPPEPYELPFEAGARQRFAAFELEMIEAANAWDEKGIGVILDRANEIAMRLSLVIALSLDPRARSVPDEAAAWAIDYVRHCQLRLAEAVEQYVADSAFERMVKECYAAIVKAGPRGVTEREMVKASRPFRKLMDFEREAVLKRLGEAGMARFVIVPTRGRKREAWVAIRDEADEA